MVKYTPNDHFQTFWDITQKFQLVLKLVSFKAIVSNLIYGEFDRRNCALSDIDAACKFKFQLVGLI